MDKIFSKKELYDRTPRIYKRDASEVRFLLGGIGTGNFSVNTRGKFLDWEIFNWPAKNTKFPLSFFAIRTENENMEKPISKILEARLLPPYTSSHGYLQAELVNLPRMEDSEMTCEYPFANVKFFDSELPVQVSMEAFTPFIPLNVNDSSIPGAIIRYHVKNTSNHPTEVSLVGTLPNASGFEGYDVIENLKLADSVKNVYRETGNIKGLYYEPEHLEESHLRYGNMAIMTTGENVTYKTQWFDGEWVDGIQDFWDDFTEDGRLEKETISDSVGCEFAQFHNFSFLKRREKIGSIGSYCTLAPQEEKTFEFVITWYFPNRVKAWIEFDEDYENFQDGKYGVTRNYYATQFSNAWDAGEYIYAEMSRLEKGSRDFADAMFHQTTLPYYVIDALTANITNLRSNLCFRLEDGTFGGFEGIRDDIGCGYGSVPHVWNYEQTVAFLFPELEQTMRNVEFLQETDENGCMSTRMFSVFGQKRYEMVPACDGQLGSIVRIYRDFKNSGDMNFLKTIWEKAVQAMDYAIKQWDTDGDGVLDGQQNTTYDIEFYGLNPMTDSIFLAALKCCEEMAAILGDQEHEKIYGQLYKKGAQLADKLLFNGEYYEQVLEDVDRYKYQFGKGCLSDQLLGQFLAYMSGIGEVLPKDHMKTAMESVFKYNYQTDFYHTDSVHRAYAINDEKGMVIATWPKGGRPKFPLSYAGEVWTGVEYSVAANLIYLGCVEEGLTIVKSIRDRYDGYKRNPFSEIESGHHYCRAMASWGILQALLGQKSDMYKKTLSIHPVMEEDMSSFFICGNAWGVYRQEKKNGKWVKKYDILYGTLDGIQLDD
ncbi:MULTISPECIES: GH116 family glycosyl-hydrolase [Mediterraneibacter]|uniref:GH116 family glycosyl-hydrolase n=1 Tax=Mediterraneibacter TaxID=2316020 RepID=UPI000E4BC901|nr:GH116 family glycosyl-hydrolase [Mediterraneibacter massiliensis]RGT71858.1 hypothetical protein DWX08_11855 [Ruminococcus sp. AF18-22]